MLMVYYNKILFFTLILIGQTAYAGIDGVYRTSINGFCAGGTNFHFTYDLSLEKDNTFTAVGSGAYASNFTTFSVSCEGTWSRNQRQVHLDQSTCDVTDLATYQSGETAGPLPRILTEYANDNTEVFIMFPISSTQMFTLYNDPSEIEELTIDGVLNERACSRQGVGVRLRGNNRTELPIPVGPVAP